MVKCYRLSIIILTDFVNMRVFSFSLHILILYVVIIKVLSALGICCYKITVLRLSIYTLL